LEKANTIENGQPEYAEPLQQIQDQIGVRIITFYRSDIGRVAVTIQKYYRSIEARDVVPESEWEFGYFGTLCACYAVGCDASTHEQSPGA
jgi:ppGpp synthetase/RelA/SpoT-type nucleotidyltranferase